MAMTPQERQEFDQLRRTVEQLLRVENVAFIENLKRRVVIAEVTDAIAQLDLTDLRDVTITSPVNGQVLKYDTGVWENGTDNT